MQPAHLARVSRGDAIWRAGNPGRQQGAPPCQQRSPPPPRPGASSTPAPTDAGAAATTDMLALVPPSLVTAAAVGLPLLVCAALACWWRARQLDWYRIPAAPSHPVIGEQAPTRDARGMACTMGVQRQCPRQLMGWLHLRVQSDTTTGCAPAAAALPAASFPRPVSVKSLRQRPPACR
jgi:hypothetical protein